MSNRANIQAVINHLEKVGRDSRYTYYSDKCAIRKDGLQKTVGCALHHVMWTFTSVDEPLLSIRNNLRKFAANVTYAAKMFETPEFNKYLNENFWEGADKYFRQPSTDFDDMLNYLRNRAKLAAAPVVVVLEDVPSDDTVTLTYGFVTMQLPANDPKVKELLAYIAKKLV